MDNLTNTSANSTIFGLSTILFKDVDCTIVIKDTSPDFNVVFNLFSLLLVVWGILLFIFCRRFRNRDRTFIPTSPTSDDVLLTTIFMGILNFGGSCFTSDEIILASVLTYVHLITQFLIEYSVQIYYGSSYYSWKHSLVLRIAVTILWIVGCSIGIFFFYIHNKISMLTFVECLLFILILGYSHFAYLLRENIIHHYVVQESTEDSVKEGYIIIRAFERCIITYLPYFFMLVILGQFKCYRIWQAEPYALLLILLGMLFVIFGMLSSMMHYRKMRPTILVRVSTRNVV